MAVSLKFGEKRMKIEDIEKLMFSGSIEAALCLGNYYAKKRKLNNEFYKLCIDSYIYGANNGSAICMIMVSKYSNEFSRIIDNDKASKYYYIALTANYAHKALWKADTKALRTKALNCMMYSAYLAHDNMDLIIEYSPNP